MQPPTVRTLDQLIGDSNAVYDPQRASVDARIQSAQNSGIAQEQGLQAAQTNAFNDITQAATRRGALFSGFTPDQQARYTSEKYLPALANLRAATQQTIQGLNDNRTALDTEQRKTAMGVQEGDLSRLYDYQKTQSDRQFQSDQANLAYQREMEKLRTQQAFEAKQNAANRAASQSSQPSPAQNMATALTAKTGSDGYVSQGTYGALKTQWVSGGYGSASQFDQLFAGYRNPKNNQYKLG